MIPRGSEPIIILMIVLLLFGVGRIGKIGGELGQAVGNFRKGLKEGIQEEKEQQSEEVKS